MVLAILLLYNIHSWDYVTTIEAKMKQHYFSQCLCRVYFTISVRTDIAVYNFESTISFINYFFLKIISTYWNLS